jgi:hypothetical protein
MDMQMTPRDDLENEIVVGEGNSFMSIVRCQKDSTFAKIHHDIMDDEVIGYPFEFFNSKGYPLNPKQEKKWKFTTTTLAIKRKLDTLYIEMYGLNVVEGAPNVENIGEYVEEPMHKQPRVEGVFELVEQSIYVYLIVLPLWENKVNSLNENFVEEKLTLQASLEKGKPRKREKLQIIFIVKLMVLTTEQWKYHFAY